MFEFFLFIVAVLVLWGAYGLGRLSGYDNGWNAYQARLDKASKVPEKKAPAKKAVKKAPAAKKTVAKKAAKKPAKRPKRKAAKKAKK